MINLSQLDSTTMSVCHEAASCLALGKGNHGNCHRSSSSQWSHLPHTTRDANVSNISLDYYYVYPVNSTRDATSKLSLSVSSQRLGHGKSSGGYTTLQCSTPPHSKCDTPSQLFTRLTTGYGESNSSVGSEIVTHRHS